MNFKKKIFKTFIVTVVLVACNFCTFAQARGNGKMNMNVNSLVDESLKSDQDTIQHVTTLTKEKNSYKINTTIIGGEVYGFNGHVPVMITIINDKVTKVELLPNDETPRFIEMAKLLLSKWNGKRIKDAKTLKVDAVSGATYTLRQLLRMFN